jgi:SAM-dependent methyltransferase
MIPDPSRTSTTTITSAPEPGPAVTLHRLYRQLAAQASLAPGPVVDALFGRLVDLVTTASLPAVQRLVDDPVVQAIQPRLHQLCARAETELESAWAERVMASDQPCEELERFPYYGNYGQLTRLEWYAIGGVTTCRPRRVAFVGSGPLPLSAMLLARDYGVTVTSYDRDPGAVEQGRRLAAALGLAGLTFHRADACRCPDLRGYDVVILAALVGMNAPEKRRVLRQLYARLRPGALLAARSAHGARTLLYPALDLGALEGLELLAVLHPFHQVINSVVLAQKPVPARPAVNDDNVMGTHHLHPHDERGTDGPLAHGRELDPLRR